MRFTNSDGKRFDLTVVGSEGGYPMLAISSKERTVYVYLDQAHRMIENGFPSYEENPYGYHREADI